MNFVDTRPSEHMPPPRLIVRQAASDRAWRALWDWLLAAPIGEEAQARAEEQVESHESHDQESESDAP